MVTCAMGIEGCQCRPMTQAEIMEAYMRDRPRCACAGEAQILGYPPAPAAHMVDRNND